MKDKAKDLEQKTEMYKVSDAMRMAVEQSMYVRTTHAEQATATSVLIVFYSLKRGL